MSEALVQSSHQPCRGFGIAYRQGRLAAIINDSHVLTVLLGSAHPHLASKAKSRGRPTEAHRFSQARSGTEHRLLDRRLTASSLAKLTELRGSCRAYSAPRSSRSIRLELRKSRYNGTMSARVASSPHPVLWNWRSHSVTRCACRLSTRVD